MPKKKPNTQPFYYFVMDYKHKHGMTNAAFDQVAAVAGSTWTNMTPEQRKPFEAQARSAKGKYKPFKLTSEGLDVELLEQSERREQMFKQEMREKIEHMIKIAGQTGGISEHKFFILHINLFLPKPVHDIYYPAEIGVSCFTLQDGVLDVFHKIVAPGELPLGYAGEAKIHSQNCHQLYNPACSMDHNNIRETYFELREFLKDNTKGSERMPILYTDEKNINTFTEVLDGWSRNCGDGARFTIFSLQYMMRVLKNTCYGANAWFSDTHSSRVVEKDVYCYTAGISCKFHDVTDVIHHCSRSYVLRYAYLVCDNCCEDLNIRLIAGRHLPPKSKAPSKSGSVSSFSTSSRASSVVDDDVESISSFASSARSTDWDNQSVCSSSTIVDDTVDEIVSSLSGNNLGSDNSCSLSSGFSRRPPALPAAFRNFREDLQQDGTSSELRDYASGLGKYVGRGGYLETNRGMGRGVRGKRN